MPEPFPWSNWTLSYDLTLEEIVYAERFGYDEVWVGEHHTGAYENIPAPDIFIAKASALTHRIGLGTGTINLPYHDPFMVAERLAFLDHLTHGRLIYGFGGGGLVSDRTFFQVGDEAGPRMREALDIIELLFSTPSTWTSPASSGSSTTSASRCGPTRSTRSSRSPACRAPTTSSCVVSAG